MPLPLLLLPAIPEAVAWLGGALVSLRAAMGAVAVYELYPIARERVAKKWNELGPSLLQFAMTKYGLEMDVSKGINDETLTAFFNNKLLTGTGLQLDSVLDRDKAKRGFERIAMEQVSQRIGLGPVSSMKGVRSALQDWIVQEVGAQLAVEAGEVIDVATARAQLAAKIEKGKQDQSQWNKPTDFSNKGIKNRERQKRYRQAHKKHWVVR